MLPKTAQSTPQLSLRRRIMNPITIRYSFRLRTRSLATGQVADLFGLDEQEPPHAVAENVVLDIRPGDLALFTGSSGSGKSSLLRAAGAQLDAIDANALDLPDRPLIDALSGTVEERLKALAACGLSEARLLLRTPAELSDGERCRFRLAYALEGVRNQGSGVRADEDRRQPDSALTPDPRILCSFLLADEFAAILDRALAKVLAFNVRKLCSRTGVGFLLATSHDDLTDDLNPDLHVRCLCDGAIDCARHEKKKRSASRTSFGSRKAPAATGRTSIGGITAATPSPSFAASCCSGAAANLS